MGTVVGGPDAPVPIFKRTADGHWYPDNAARGPFDGLQGGGIAALLCCEIEATSTAEGLGTCVSASTHFLRPAPMAPLRVNVTPLRIGRRVSVFDAMLTSKNIRIAVQRTTLITEIANSALPVPPPCTDVPASYPRSNRKAPHGGPWLMDVMEVRRGEDGTEWFRLLRPIALGGSRMGEVLAAADWAHGLGAPLGTDRRPPAAIPNPDLCVHLFRPPKGAWIGVRHGTAWSTSSIGAGWGELRDEVGMIGCVAMSVAITMR